MSNGAGAASGAAAAHAAIANAIKASGVIIRVENKDFLVIIGRVEKPLVVMTEKSFWSPSYKYISSYKGLAFFTKSSEPLRLPNAVELVSAKKIHVPS